MNGLVEVGGELGKAVNKLRESAIRQKGKVATRTRAPLGSVQLPLWPEDVRGLPNPLARSALFTVGNRNQPRLMIKNKLIACASGVKILYQGEELRQEDEDAFLQILHISRHHQLGDPVELTAHAVLTDLGWGRSSRMYTRLKETLLRLSATALTVSSESEDRGFSGSLIRKFAWQGEDGNTMKRWLVWLEPELISLFGQDMYTQIYWEQRLALSSPLARWLHGYYYTHREPFPLKVKTLHFLCGSRAKAMSDFKHQLLIALDGLVTVGFLSDWELEQRSGLIKVVRRPPPRSLTLL